MDIDVAETRYTDFGDIEDSYDWKLIGYKGTLTRDGSGQLLYKLT